MRRLYERRSHWRDRDDLDSVIDESAVIVVGRGSILVQSRGRAKRRPAHSVVDLVKLVNVSRYADFPGRYRGWRW